MPNKLFRLLRMVSLVLEASKASSEGYFNANTAKPDISESLRVNCRPRTGSSNCGDITPNDSHPQTDGLVHSLVQ